MSRWAALAFLVVCGAMFTGVLEPLTQGRHGDQWAILLTPLAATVGLAIAVRAWRMLFAPLALAFAGVVAVGDDPLAMAAVAAGGVVLLVIAAVAVAVARHIEPSVAAVTLCFVAAAAPVVWGTVDTVRRHTAPELPSEVIEQLPLEESLGNLCPGASTRGHVSRRLRRETEVLLRELREHPHSLVPYTYHYSDEPAEHKQITVRELAEEQLNDLENGGDDCAPDLQRRLRDAL